MISVSLWSGGAGWSDWKFDLEREMVQAGQAAAAFDLATCLIPREEILRGGPAKDGIPALTKPAIVAGSEAGYLRAEDRVVGVVIGGVSRAYPLRILSWHENVNDIVGGQAVAVTYCPLCDSAVVFDRNIGGRVLEFGISGRLYNSNVLLYDRQPDGKGESLWSQLQMRAVTGPAAEQGLRLRPMASELTSWGDWRERHRGTTVMSLETGHARNYTANPYADYFASDKLMFPVRPAPDLGGGLRNKDRVVVVWAGSEMRAYPVKTVAKSVGDRGWMEDTLGGETLRLTYSVESDSVRVSGTDAAGSSPSVVHTFWFAWSAMHPEGDVFGR